MASNMMVIVVLSLIDVILIMEHCSAQNQNLIEQNINMIPGRTFQNTLQAMQPATFGINNSIRQSNSSPRIRLLSFSNRPLTNNNAQSSNPLQLLGLRAGQQISSVLQQGTRRVAPTEQLGGAQQLGDIQANIGRLLREAAQRGASGQVTGEGQLRVRQQQVGGLTTNQGRLGNDVVRGGTSLRGRTAPAGQQLGSQQPRGIQQSIGSQQLIGNQQSSGNQQTPGVQQLGGNRLSGGIQQTSRIQQSSGSQQSTGNQPLRRTEQTSRNQQTRVGQQTGGSQQLSRLQTNPTRLVLGTNILGASRQVTLAPIGQRRRAQQPGGLSASPGSVVTGDVRGRASRRIVLLRPSGSQSIGNLSSLIGPQRQANVGRTNIEQLRRLVNNRQLPRSPAQFRPGPLSRDPRTGLLVQRLSSQTSPESSNLLPLGPIPTCQTNATYVCQPLRRIQDRSRARRCVGACATGRCLGACVCACVSRIPSSIQRLEGQVAGNSISTRTAQPNRASSVQSPTDLNFTLDNSILARLLAEPDLNMLVGPDGINQILRGEPPTLLRRQSSGQHSHQGNITGTGNGTTNTNNVGIIDTGVPIPLGLTQSSLTTNPMLANILTSGEGFRELSSEIRTEMLGNTMPSLTEFQRSNVNALREPSIQGLGEAQSLSAPDLDATFLGAILPMPRPISLSRDSHRSRDRTRVVVNPVLLDSGVVEPVRRRAPPRSRFGSMRSRVETLENVFDANSPFETISDVLSGNNAIAAAALNLNMMRSGSRNTAGALSRDSRFLENMMRTSGNQDPSDVAVMAAMMQSIGGAVDAVSAANSRNRSAGTAMSRGITEAAGALRGPAANQTSGNLIENFLTGTVKSTDHGMSIPTAEECFAQGRELWCDPFGIWENTPGLSRWCLMNCRSSSNICDQNRCDCKCVDTETFRRNISAHSM